MKIPTLIVIDPRGPKEGANVKAEFISVREENKDQLLKGLKGMMPKAKFTFMSLEELKNKVK